MTGYVDVHAETADTVCTTGGTFYALAGTKTLHGSSSGDWSIAANNRLAHVGSKAEKYLIVVGVSVTGNGNTTMQLSVTTYDQGTVGGTRAEDIDAVITLSNSVRGQCVVSGILDIPAGRSEVEVVVSCGTSSRTVTLHTMNLTLVEVG